jgi:hypothetical protein
MFKVVKPARNALRRCELELVVNRLPLIISTIALIVSLGSAWFTVFRPARIIGDLSYITLWRLSSNNDGVVTDTAVAPAFWLRNIGARSIIISDLRLVFMPTDGSRYEAYPGSSLPQEAIDGASEFHDYGRLSTGSPFRSFSLVASEQWTSSYRFGVSQEALQQLMGRVRVALEVNSGNGTSWASVFEDSLDFGTKPFHLQPMIGGAQSIPVYTQRWQARRSQ